MFYCRLVNMIKPKKPNNSLLNYFENKNLNENEKKRKKLSNSHKFSTSSELCEPIIISSDDDDFLPKKKTKTTTRIQKTTVTKKRNFKQFELLNINEEKKDLYYERTKKPIDKSTPTPKDIAGTSTVSKSDASDEKINIRELHEGNTKYYHKNFFTLLDFVLENEEDRCLFSDENENDLLWAENFKQLPLQQQQLYIRLYHRKSTWIKSDKVLYICMS